MKQSDPTIEAALERVRLAMHAAHEAEGTPEAGERCRQLFRELGDLLGFYAPLPTPSSPHVGLPPNVASMLKGLFGELAVGNLPGPIRDCISRRGARAPGPSEAKPIAIAVAYVKAVRAGAITDRSPIKTVNNAYGVSRQTAQRWVRETAPLDGWREYPADHLQWLMEEAGRRHKFAGRSENAIRARDRSKRKV